MDIEAKMRFLLYILAPIGNSLFPLPEIFNNFDIILIKNCNLLIPRPPIKNAQATEAFSP